jgi:hypothetical protein
MSGGNHTFNGSGKYTLGLSISVGQDQWRWCNKCQCLAFDGYSVCTTGGAHTHVGSSNYKLTYNDPEAPGQPNWKWCNKCVFSFLFLNFIEGATGVMDWHTQETVLESARAGAVDTILVQAAIMFSVPQLKVKAIGRGVASVSCCGMAGLLPGLVQQGVRTPRKALEIISFHLFDDERFIDERKL